METTIHIFNPMTDEFPQGWTEFLKEEGLLAVWHPEALKCVASTSEAPVMLAVAYGQAGILGVFSGKCISLIPPHTYVPTTQSRSQKVSYFQCYLPLSFSPGLAIAKHLNESEAQVVIRAFEKALFAKVSFTCLGILYLWIPEQYQPFFARTGYLRRLSASAAYLENQWTTIDDYFHSLPTKRRKHFQRLYEANQKSKHFTLFEGQASIDALRATRLASLTRTKYHTVRGHYPPIPVQYFEYMNRQEGTFYFGYEHATEGLLAFDITLLDSAGHLYTTINGSTYSPITQRSFLYFDLYLREVDFMIKNKLKGIYFGPGLLELKQNFGCIAYEQHLIARSRFF